MTAGAIFSGFFGPSAPAGAETADEIAYRRLFYGLQQPTDREAERFVDLILELLEEGRVSEAAPLVEARFGAASDSLNSDGESLKGLLAETLAALEPGPRRRLRAVLEGAFRKRLTDARSPTDWRRLAAESPPTVYGADALVGLARVEQDTGSYAAAARAYERAAAASLEVGERRRSERLSELAAINRRRRGSEDEVLSGSPVSAAVRSDRLPVSWCGSGGDATRRGMAQAEPPRGWCDWRVDLRSGSSGLNAEDQPPRLASGATVAARGVLVTKTSYGLTAIKAASGKRVWQTPLPSLPEGARPPIERGLSSDGQRVFAVVSGAGGRGSDSATWPFGAGRLRRGRREDATNALVAFDLPRQGKVAWRVDGADEGPLSGARFLGPPAADEGRLYALVDRGQSICLVEIEAASGAVGWVQPLVGRPNGRGADEAISPISPTVGERLVFCPTGAGALVAVDPLSRRLAWTHYLSLSKSNKRRSQQRSWRRVWDADPEAWRHARVVRHDNLLTVVSPVAPVVETLDASTGEVVWSRHHRQGLLLAAVANDEVLLVERGRVLARRSADGEQVWSVSLPSGENVAGEGLLLGSRYVLPLGSGRLLVVDTVAEKPSSRLVAFGQNPIESSPDFGDLLAYQGGVYSSSTGSIERLRRGGAPNGPLDEAIDALVEGRARAARDLLVEVVRQRPSDLAAAEVYAAASLRAGFEAGDGIPLARVGGPHAEAQAALARLGVALSEGDSETAARLVERLAGSPSGIARLTPEAGWRVTADRLARGRLVGAFPGEARRGDKGLAGSVVSDLEATNALWSLRQIEARVDFDASQAAPKGPANRRRAIRPLPLTIHSVEGDPEGPLSWNLKKAADREVLLGVDRWGDLAFARTLRVAFRSPPSIPSLSGDLQPQGVRFGDRIALPVSGATAVYNTRDGTLAWMTEATDREDVETPIAIGPWGVLTKSDRRLRCRRLEGGEVAWSRESLRGRTLYPRVLVVGDELFVALKRREGVRLSAWSGERRGEWKPPRPLMWGSQAGKNLCVVDPRSGPDGAGLRDLFVVSVEQPQDPLLHVKVAAGSLMTAVTGAPGLVAIRDRQGVLRLVDVGEAAVRFRSELGEGARVEAIRARQAGGRLLVEVDRSRPAQNRTEGVSAVGDTPLLTGELHCLDPRTGESAWVRPAEVSALSLLRPRADSPLLLFARRQTPAAGSDDAEATLSLVALDRRTGATVFRHYGLPAGDESRGERPVRVQRQRGGGDQVTVRLGRAVVTLTPTGVPAPPRPPRVAGVEDPRAKKTNEKTGLDLFLDSLPLSE